MAATGEILPAIKTNMPNIIPSINAITNRINSTYKYEIIGSLNVKSKIVPPNIFIKIYI
jgi:hypothetical protein